MDYNVDNIESKGEINPTMDTDIVLHKDGKFQRAKIFGFNGKIKPAFVESVINETNNNYTVDPDQIVPSEALYNDTPETLAGDVIKRVDKNTGTDVNYREVTTWHDGTAMTEAKADGVIYIKKDSKYYKTVSQGKDVFPISLWNNSIDGEISISQFNQSIAFYISTGFKFMQINRVVNLGGANVTLPKNLILDFKGGKIINGTLTGQNNPIISEKVEIFKDLLIRGTWNVKQSSSKWFFLYNNGYQIDKITTIESTGNEVLRSKVKKIGGEDKYYVNGVAYNYQTAPSIPYNDDTTNLQQLLNLKAKHTIIEKDVVAMINGNTSEDMEDNAYGGLTVRSWRDATLEINGVLKQIQGNQTNASVLRVEFCKNLRICGSGTIQGDTLEHISNAGEGNMGLRIHSTSYLKVENLRFELFFGDGVFVSWNRRGTWLCTPEEIALRNDQRHHEYINIKCYENRRTGLVFEKGDFVDYDGCEFSYTSTRRGASTFSGVDIEPFGDESSPVRGCRGHSFRKCRFIGNDAGVGLRAERALDLVIDNNYFEGNNHDITILRGVTSIDKSWIESKVSNNGADRKFVSGFSVIKNNVSYDSRRFLTSGISHTSVIVENNRIQNCFYAAINGIFKNSIFKNNYFYNIGYVLDCSSLKNVSFEGNEFHHIINGFPGSPRNNGDGEAIKLRVWGGSDIDTGEVFKIENVDFRNNKFIDYSGKILYGSGVDGKTPLPNSWLTSYFLLRTRQLTSPEFYKNVKFIDNILPRKRFVTPHLDMDVLYNPSGEYVIQFKNDIGYFGDEKLLLLGDHFYDKATKQKGRVVKGGWIGIYDYFQFTPYGEVPPDSIIYNPATPTKLYTTVNGGTMGATMSGWESGTVSMGNIDMTPPVIEWEGIGRTSTANRPTLYNNVGRAIYDTDLSKVIYFDGSIWRDAAGTAV